eukprot:scaffold3410_cov158-Amphora_coffeaeformis.AAC.16
MKSMLKSSLLYYGIVFGGSVLLTEVSSFTLLVDPKPRRIVAAAPIRSSDPSSSSKRLMWSPVQQQHQHKSRSSSSRRSVVTLQSSSNNSHQDDETKPKIRFSGIDLDRDRTSRKSPVDIFFSSLTSDVTSIALGTVGLLVLLVGRLILDSPAGSDEEVVSAEALGVATRVNLLAVFACGAILLNGVSKLDIQSAMAERVQLLGIRLRDPVLLGSEFASNVPTTVTWVLESLLTASPASSVVLLQTEGPNDSLPWQIKGYAGVVPENLVNEGPEQTELPIDTPILDRLRRATTESYLPTLQALPGRFEFTSYLPSNTQAVLLLPIIVGGRQAAVVLGANQARSFTPRDIAWCQVVANRLAGDK